MKIAAIRTTPVLAPLPRQPDGTIRLVVEGRERVRIEEMTQVRPYLQARVAVVEETTPPASDLELAGSRRPDEHVGERDRAAAEHLIGKLEQPLDGHLMMLRVALVEVRDQHAGTTT